MRVLLHTGKGGVGKTTVALATALRAAECGHRVFVLSTDPAHSLGDALGRPVGPAPVEVAPGVVAREVGVLDELDRAWSEIQRWLRELLRDETDELVAEELLVFPGMEELVSLRGVREAEATGDFDLCVVDCAPTGATLRMLRFPDALRVFMEHFFDLERRGARLLRPLLDRLGSTSLLPREEFFEAFERLYREVEDVRCILMDTERSSARLVLNPNRVVVDETRRSFAYLSLYGVATDAVVVNRQLPEDLAPGYFGRWLARQRESLAEIEASFPVPRLAAPLQAAEVRGVPALAGLGRALFGEVDPARVLHRSRPIRLRKRGAQSLLEIDLPGATKDGLDVVLAGPDLHVRVRDARRRIALPASLQGCPLASVHLEDGVLEVAFGPA